MFGITAFDSVMLWVSAVPVRVSRVRGSSVPSLQLHGHGSDKRINGIITIFAAGFCRA